MNLEKILIRLIETYIYFFFIRIRCIRESLIIFRKKIKNNFLRISNGLINNVEKLLLFIVCNVTLIYLTI